METFSFQKMHGAGNDFVVLDGRGAGSPASGLPEGAFSAAGARAIAARHTGVGCDQVVLIEDARDATAHMRIRNADGGEVGTCGNATRCVALLLMDERGEDRVTIATKAGVLEATRDEAGRISVDMGPAQTDWQAIPLKAAADTLHLALGDGALGDAVAVSMGNPHAVFFVEDAEKVPLGVLGPILERDPIFPERANIGIAQMLGVHRLRLRVWERGAGLTPACGSGACAAVVAASRRGLLETGAAIEVVQDGGNLFVCLRDDGHVLLAGPAVHSFSGKISGDWLSREMGT